MTWRGTYRVHSAGWFCYRPYPSRLMLDNGEDTMRLGHATHQLDIVGNSETCELLGISKATLARWMRPSTGDNGPLRSYMIEWKSVAAGPVWDRQDVVDFASTDPRKRARGSRRA
jgi:hypothetical protein